MKNKKTDNNETDGVSDMSERVVGVVCTRVHDVDDDEGEEDEDVVVTFGQRDDDDETAEWRSACVLCTHIYVYMCVYFI